MTDNWPSICRLKISLLYKDNKIGDFKISGRFVTVGNMAEDVGIDPTAFGLALRKAKFPPRKVKCEWEVQIGSDDYSAMRSVLVSMFYRRG